MMDERMGGRLLRIAGQLSGAAMVLGLFAAWGCADGSGTGPVRASRTVSASDFAVAGSTGEGSLAPRVSVDDESVEVAAPATPGEVVVVMGRPGEAAHAPSRAVEGPERPPIVAGVAPLPERRYLVDQMVGQINGRPIYADAFFAPMDARLRREATRMQPREWMAMARRDIDAALIDRLRDELLLAEFESRLTEEQQQGLLSFVESIRRSLVSENYGAESLASERFLEVEGLTLDQKVDDLTKAQFVLAQLRNAIGSRVSVSQREIRQFYEQNYNEFNPKPTAVYRVLQVPDTEAERLVAVMQAFEQGVPFEDLVRSEGTWRRDEGGMRSIVLEDGTTAGVQLFAFDELNEPARRLQPGEMTERVSFRGSQWWIYLEKIDRPPRRSLYEAQLEIESALVKTRQIEEQNRYFAQLLERGSFSDIRQMSDRLLQFAADRYLIQPADAAARLSSQGANGK